MKYALEMIAVSVATISTASTSRPAAQAGTAPWRAAPTASISMPATNPIVVR